MENSPRLTLGPYPHDITKPLRIKKNDTAYLSRFNAVEGVESVTLLEYSGEYLS